MVVDFKSPGSMVKKYEENRCFNHSYKMENEFKKQSNREEQETKHLKM